MTDEEFAELARNYQPPITITKEEAVVIKSLLDFYEACANDHSHGYSCECGFCEDVLKVGSQKATLFDSLEEKVK